MKITLSENKTRNGLLDKAYNPLTGEGSDIPRFVFTLGTKEKIHLPDSMKDEKFIQDILKAGSLVKYIKGFPGDNEESYEFALAFLISLRYKHDFEYWAYQTLKIKHKLTGAEIPFKLNRGQRRLIARFEKMRNAGVPIRVVLLKARQWGGSTLTQLYAMWIQIIHRVNWNSCIVGDVESQATNIRGMYSLAAKLYPTDLGDATLKPYEGSSKNRQIQETGAVISIGSMQKPDSLRSTDIKIAHFSEVGLWKETVGKKPRDLIQSIKASVPNIADTLIVEESTAKGIGNYFHKTWLRASSGKSGYDPVFVAWQDIEMYRVKLDCSVNEFIHSWGDPEGEIYKYNMFLWQKGATLEGIKWYNWFLETEFGGDRWVMMSEFPTTAQEAFQATGERVFKPKYVQQARLNNREPEWKGILSADDRTGKGAFKNISFESQANGELHIWAKPDNSVKVKNRYLSTLDVGGASKGADWHVIRVFDRLWMMDGGVPEAILTWKFHADQDIASWRAAQVAKWYNDALLVVESNVITKKKNTEGNGFLTVLNTIIEDYTNIYTNTKVDQIKEGLPVRYGFHHTQSSKVMVKNATITALREDGYIEYDSACCDEYDTYEFKADGTMGSVDGEHDDIAMSTMNGLWVSLYDMEFPKYIVERPRKPRANKITAADF